MRERRGSLHKYRVRFYIGRFKIIFIGIVLLELMCVAGYDLGTHDESPLKDSSWLATNPLTPNPIGISSQKADARTVNVLHESHRNSDGEQGLHTWR